MFGFGAISELPLSTLPGGVTHLGSATLDTIASASYSKPSLEGVLVSSASTSVTVAAAGQLIKLGSTSLSSSATQASSAMLEIGGVSTVAASVTLAPVQELTLKAVILTTGPATISASGTLTKLGTSSLSASGTVAAEGTAIRLGSASLSPSVTLAIVPELTLKAVILTTGPATITANSTRDIHVASSISGSGSISSSAVVEKLGRATLGTGSPFTNGFSKGFDEGTFVSGHGFVAVNHLEAVATLTATAGVFKFFDPITLPAVATLNAKLTALGSMSLQSIGSLSGNSVLLHGGSTNLSSVASIEAKLLSTTENADIVSFSLHIDKLRGLDGYISKTKNITGYIDKELSVSSYIDKDSGITGYIDKIVEKTLVRER